MIRRICIATVLVFWATVAFAQTAPATFEDGRIAAEAGQYDRARDIWNRLAQAGDAESQNALGYIYQHGLGVLRDYPRAVQLYTSAAEQGIANAANNLGFMYTQGQGVPRDYVRAYSWYSLAAIQGEVASIRNRNILARAMSYKDLQAANKISIEAIARIAKRMTPEQITAARERAQKLLSDRRGADAQNATIVTVPRTRLEGAPQGLVNVPSDRTGAVLSSDRSEEEMAEEDTGPKLPSLTPLN
jgi:TPR repeat protein